MTNNYHTIKSGIIQDALHAISQNPFPKSYVGGGISLQFTLPEYLHRVTSDVDLTTSQFTTVPEYRQYVAQAFEDLVNRGYSLNVKKSRSTLDAHLERDQDHLMVQIPRRSKRNFESRKKILEREVSNSRSIQYKNTDLKVIAYEDLIGHKALRGVTFMDSYNLSMPRSCDPAQFMSALNTLKKDFDQSRFSLTPEESAQQLAIIRLHADVFDIQALFEMFSQEIDEPYLAEVIESYNGSKEKRRKWNLLLEEIKNRV